MQYCIAYDPFFTMMVRLSHSLNALPSILVTLSGILMEFSFLHSENASYPISLTLSGIVMVVRLVHM